MSKIKVKENTFNDVTEEQFNKYREIQFSGVTNMIYVEHVVTLSGLTRECCLLIQKQYSELEKKYGKYKGKK